jgi:hypothetical protein
MALEVLLYQADIIFCNPIQENLFGQPSTREWSSSSRGMERIDPKRKAFVWKLFSQTAFQFFPNLCHGCLELIRKNVYG